MIDYSQRKSVKKLLDTSKKIGKGVVTADQNAWKGNQEQ